jgi:hypothetical protein
MDKFTPPPISSFTPPTRFEPPPTPVNDFGFVPHSERQQFLIDHPDFKPPPGYLGMKKGGAIQTTKISTHKKSKKSPNW